MNEYVITTDNNSDLPEKYLTEHGVGCMYLSYAMDGKNYTHGNFLPEHEFYEAMRNGSMPTTAQVNPENARVLLEPYLKEGKDILHIAFSSGLSGTYNSCRIAAEELMEEYPDRKIIVIDSLAASLGQGFLVYLAQEKKEQGEDIETVARWAEENKLHIVHLFTVNDLNHLYRGGRVSRTTAVVGSMLNIKPVLHVDNDGKLTAIGKVRGRKKSLQELVKLMDEKIRQLPRHLPHHLHQPRRLRRRSQLRSRESKREIPDQHHHHEPGRSHHRRPLRSGNNGIVLCGR